MCLGVLEWLMIYVALRLQAQGSCLPCRRKTLTGGTPTWCKLTRVCVFIDARVGFIQSGFDFLSFGQVHPVLLERRVEWCDRQNGAE